MLDNTALQKVRKKNKEKLDFETIGRVRIQGFKIPQTVKLPSIEK